MADANANDEVAALKRLIEITGLLSSTLDLDELLEQIMFSAAELLDAETSSLMLVDEESGDLNITTATGKSGEQVTRRQVPAHKGIAGWVVDKNEIAVVEAPEDDARFYPVMDKAIQFETRNLVAVPLRVRDETIGAVEVINKREGSFTELDVELAQALANQAAIAIDNTRLYAKLADAVVTSRLSYRL
jgi:GAF domain-containing protein